MQTQVTNGALRRRALTVAGALSVVALVAVAPVAARPDFASGTDARALRATLPVKYSVTAIPHHERPTVLVHGAALPHLLPTSGNAVFQTALVNTAGVVSPVGVPSLVDDTGHSVNGKGYRVGGAMP